MFGMNLEEKQDEFLMKIRKTGMNAVMKTLDSDEIREFEGYVDYLDTSMPYDGNLKKDYTYAVLDILSDFEEIGNVNPNDLLLTLGAFTKYIKEPKDDLESDELKKLEDPEEEYEF